MSTPSQEGLRNHSTLFHVQVLKLGVLSINQDYSIKKNFIKIAIDKVEGLNSSNLKTEENDRQVIWLESKTF